MNEDNKSDAGFLVSSNGEVFVVDSENSTGNEDSNVKVDINSADYDHDSKDDGDGEIQSINWKPVSKQEGGLINVDGSKQNNNINNDVNHEEWLPFVLSIDTKK